MLLLLGAGLSRARSKTDIKIVPGPIVMTDEERAIVPDPAKGIEHAVILIEESKKNEEYGWESEIAYHLRAKILSNEGRDLANIEIPFNARAGDLDEWWGRTILPDGTVIELKQAELREQTVERFGSWEVRHLKAALPRVVPGCVIDYGYSYKGRTRLESMRIPLQKRWPVRQFRYRWVPFQGRSASFRLGRAEGLTVSASNDNRSVLVMAQDLPAVVDEPWMPPESEVQAAVTFYYFDYGGDAEDFWNTEAKRVDRGARYFCARKKPLRKAIASMSIPPEADLDGKLRAAYDWIADNIKNTSLQTAEEMEAAEADVRKERYSAKDVLAARAGRSTQLDHLFVCLARELGADARIVRAADRTRNFWDRNLRSMSQLSGTLVAVRAPGQPLESATVVDPGSGLPYGEVPWWFTGAHAMVATPGGMQVLGLRPAPATHNISDTSVEIEFAPDNSSLRARWSRSTSGQQGYLERRILRAMPPEYRRKRLEEYCGSSGRLEVERAETLDLDRLTSPLKLVCEAESTETGMNGAADRDFLDLEGAWIEPVPEFTSRTRTLPVVFHFPRSERQSIDVNSPHGFGPVEPPPMTRIDGPYGSYLRSISTTPLGYHVERAFSLTTLKIEPEEYEPLRRFLIDVRRADSAPLEFARTDRASR